MTNQLEWHMYSTEVQKQKDNSMDRRVTFVMKGMNILFWLGFHVHKKKDRGSVLESRDNNNQKYSCSFLQESFLQCWHYCALLKLLCIACRGTFPFSLQLKLSMFDSLEFLNLPSRRGAKLFLGSQAAPSLTPKMSFEHSLRCHLNKFPFWPNSKAQVCFWDVWNSVELQRCLFSKSL